MYLSIFGDSISTYKGYSNSVKVNNTLGGNAVEYKGNSLGISSVNETWWMQLANQTGMKLLVNNSSAGGRLSRSNDRKF